MRTSFKMYPLYGKHFTQPPSLQAKLFLGCNPICLIFKVLRQDGFLGCPIFGLSPPTDPLTLIVQRSLPSLYPHSATLRMGTAAFSFKTYG